MADLSKYKKATTTTATSTSPVRDLSKYKKSTTTPVRPALPAAAPAQSPLSTGIDLAKDYMKAKTDFAVGAASGFSAPGRFIKNKVMNPILRTAFGGDNPVTKDVKPYAPATLTGQLGEVAGETATYFAAPGPQALASLSTPARIGARMGINATIAGAQTESIKKGASAALIAEALTGAAQPVAQAGKLIYKGLAIPTSATEAARLQTYRANTPLPKRVAQAFTGKSTAPITADETAFSKGLMGTESMIGVQAKRAQKEVWDKTVAPALKNSKATVSLDSFFDDAEKAIIKSNPDLTRQKSLLNALSAIREDYAGTGAVNMTKLQDLKAGWAKWVPEKAYRGEDISASLNEVRNVLASNARETIKKNIADPAVQRAYIDYGNLGGLTKLGQRAMTGAKLKGGEGSFLSGVKDAVVTPIATVGGRVLYKAANGSTYLAAPGAKTIADLVVTPEEEQQ
jgi:hypothetical protein